MRVVLDTNVLWISIPRYSPSNWLIRDLLNQEYTLCVTTDILEEYEEIIERFLGAKTAQNFMDFLEVLPNVEKITRHIRWQLITNDPDDQPPRGLGDVIRGKPPRLRPLGDGRRRRHYDRPDQDQWAD